MPRRATPAQYDCIESDLRASCSRALRCSWVCDLAAPTDQQPPRVFYFHLRFFDRFVENTPQTPSRTPLARHLHGSGSQSDRKTRHFDGSGSRSDRENTSLRGVRIATGPRTHVTSRGPGRTRTEKTCHLEGSGGRNRIEKTHHFEGSGSQFDRENTSLRGVRVAI